MGVVYTYTDRSWYTIIKITNKFGVAHDKSITHEGLDFITDDLIVKYPFYRGRVIYIGNETSGLGKYVVFRWVDKDNRTKIVVMGHFENIYVAVNDVVFKDHKIGKMGQTGNAHGIHCHLEVHSPIDPEPLLEA